MRTTNVKTSPKQTPTTSSFLARSPVMREHAAHLERAAELDANVLIHGPIGSGRTTAARLIHELGNRAGGPLAIVHATETPAGQIRSVLRAESERALSGGTLVVEQVEDLSAELQREFMQFLQGRILVSAHDGPRLDVRVIVTTSTDLAERAANGHFREDLYFRLSVLRIEVPALDQRREDLPDLIDRFIARCGPRLQLTGEAREQLLSYGWPGNLRELWNVVERAHAFCRGDVIGPELLQFDAPMQRTKTESRPNLAGYTMEQIERWALLDTLDSLGGNKAAAARALGVCEKTIYNKLKRMDRQERQDR